jgi:beta-glucosidase
VALLDGVVGAVSPGTQVYYAEGCSVRAEDRHGFDEAVRVAGQAEAVIACFGYSPELEGEEGEVVATVGTGDRAGIGLPGLQEELLLRLHATGKPVVLVLTGGSPIAFPEAAAQLPAILMAWYPGAEGGAAVAEVLFGAASPAGRLPLTFVRSLEQVPAFTDYRMQGRTYRFLREPPLYRFGYGLSYTTFEYDRLEISPNPARADQEIEVTARVRNAGAVAGDEVVQLYVTDAQASVPVPLLHLEGVRRVHLKPDEARQVSFTLAPAQLAAYDDEGRPFVEPGEFVLGVGGGQPHDPASRAVTASLWIK